MQILAQTAQSVQNTPKQHIANKAPTDDATTGAGGAEQPASSSGVPSLSCNIAKELERWRGGAKSRLLSSGMSRAHIRPWESRVPIRAPRPSPAAAANSDQRSSSSGGPSQQRRSSSFSSPRPLKQSPADVIGGKHVAGGDGEAAPLPLPGQRARPATAGALRSRSTAARTGASSTGSDGRRGLAQGARLGPVEDAGPSNTTAPRRVRGGGATPSAAPLARGGIPSSASENMLPSTRSRDRDRNGGEAAWRVFDSTAAEWVHTVVLEHRGGASAAAAEARGAVAATLSSAAAKPNEDGGARLTAAAESATEEIFGRYDRSGAAGRGFLRSAEISALQELWTRPDAVPPQPRVLPSSASRLPSKRPRQTSPQALATTGSSRKGSANGSGDPAGASEARDGGGGRDTRVLTRAGFVEFCRRAAGRDAIFIRHLFTRSGYDYRLELPVPPSREKSAVATSVESATEARASPSGRRGNRPTGSEKATGTGGSLGGGGSGGAGRGKEPTNSHLGTAARPQERGLFMYEDDDVLCLASGGIVDPGELWLWTEDERDHGERQNLDGLLSRGGGAHVSRAAATSIVGAFAGTNRSSSKTTQASEECRADDAGATTATPCFNETVDRPVGPKTAEDVTSVAKTTRPKSVVDASTPPVHGEGFPAGQYHSDQGSTAARAAESMKCEWCGGVVVANDRACHSAAFCDEDCV